MVLGRNTRRIDAGYPKPASLSPRRRLLGTAVSRPDPRLVHRIWMSWPRIRPPPPPQKSQAPREPPPPTRGLWPWHPRAPPPTRGSWSRPLRALPPHAASSLRGIFGGSVGGGSRFRCGVAQGGKWCRRPHSREGRSSSVTLHPCARGKVSAGWEKERSRTTNPGE